mmetsp:Transcript_21664/g.55165  ORF Transcript_21664/g.55165 Transcript_21664/m.55165 type:complete len:207 (+) Transcript_21664:2272-2892(+)
MSMRSIIMSASLSTGHATSSMSIDVPGSRAAPTMGIRPLRTSHSVLHALASWWKGYASIFCGAAALAPNGRPWRLSARMTSSMDPCSAPSSRPRHSMSSAAAMGSAPLMSGTSLVIASSASHSRRDARSNSSTASTAVSLRRMDAPLQAARTSGNTMNADALCGHSGTVLYVACDTNPNVPSLPIIRCLMISMGLSSGKSTSALSE